MLEKTLEGLLDSKEIKPVNPKGNQPWIGRTDSEAPILWPPGAKGPLLGKDSDAGKDWRQEEKGVTEDERVEWHHRLKGHEFEQALGNSDGQGGLACCSPWGHKASDVTGQLSNKQSDDSRPVGEGSWGTRNTLKTTKRPRRCPRGDQGESYRPTVGVDGETQARWPRKGRLRGPPSVFSDKEDDGTMQRKKHCEAMAEAGELVRDMQLLWIQTSGISEWCKLLGQLEDELLKI